MNPNTYKIILAGAVGLYGAYLAIIQEDRKFEQAFPEHKDDKIAREVWKRARQELRDEVEPVVRSQRDLERLARDLIEAGKVQISAEMRERHPAAPDAAIFRMSYLVARHHLGKPADAVAVAGRGTHPLPPEWHGQATTDKKAEAEGWPATPIK